MAFYYSYVFSYSKAYRNVWPFRKKLYINFSFWLVIGVISLF